MVYILNGVAFSMILFIVATGLNISFGILGIVNFAHGVLFLLGAYFTYTIIKIGGNFWIALIIVPLIIALIGGIMEFFFIRHLYKRHHAYNMLLTFAMVLALYDLIRLFWGSEVKTVSPPELFLGAVSIFGKDFPVVSIFIIIGGLLVGLGIWFGFQKTKFGKILRAVSLDPEIANALGFNVVLTYTFAFMLGALMAGLGGVLGSLKLSVAPGIDAEFLIYSFAIVVIGGVGSFRGTFIASLIVGEMHVLGAVFFPDFAMAFIFVLLVVFLSIYPRGLFGREIEQIHIPIAPYTEDFKLRRIPLFKRFSPISISITQTILVILLFSLIPVLFSKYWLLLFAEILIFGLFALSFNIMFGFTGMLSFGQAAIFGVGAYTVSLLMIKLNLSWGIAFLLSLAFSTFVAFLIGICIIHRTEIYFAMLTMSFGQLFYSTIYKWNDLTGGADGLTGIPPPKVSILNWTLAIKSPIDHYYFVLIIVGLSYIIIRKIINSPFGQVLTAIRENPQRTDFVGLNTRKYKLMTFTIAGIFSGLSGILYAPFAGSIDVLMAHWSKSAEPIFMTLIGGIGTLFGPFVGTLFYFSLQSFISAKTEYWMLFFGAILIIIVMDFPIGITGYIKGILLKRMDSDEMRKNEPQPSKLPKVRP